MTGNAPTDEGAFRGWLEANAAPALKNVGLRRGQVVLDYGCGRGTFSIPAARIVGPGGIVHALDTDASALAELGRRAEDEALGNIRTARVDGETSPDELLPGQADVILLYDVIHLVDDRNLIVRELAGALKPGGVLSVFPMHVGIDGMLELARDAGALSLRDRQGMLLNFTRTDADDA